MIDEAFLEAEKERQLRELEAAGLVNIKLNNPRTKS